MRKVLLGAGISSFLALAVTGGMVAAGQSGLVTVLPVAVILGLAWILQRYSRRAVGYTLGTARGYALAVLHPLLVIGILIAVSYVGGWVDTAKTEWAAVGLNSAVIFAMTLVIALITEEGFFRGWLWASLQAAGWSKARVVLATSLVFALWHLPEITLSSEFGLQGMQIVVLFLNAIIIGSIWGIVRDISGSVLVSSLAHAVWNTAAYGLFGDGQEPGALGITATTFVGPEHGYLGLILNILVLAVLWRLWPRLSKE